jgi:DNA repair protein SbcD/Mre11
LDLENPSAAVTLLEGTHLALSSLERAKYKFSATSYNGRCLRVRLCHRARQIPPGYGGLVALRLLHFADLHLDRSFAAERLYGVGAHRLREDLRAALQRIIERARQADADVITCGGDLFEQDHVTRDTANYLLQVMGSAGIPVLIAPGHADPAVPSSPYRYLRWPQNVTIAAHEELRPYRFGDVQVWASGFMRREVPDAPLREFARQESGVNLLLLHASDMSQVPAGVTPYKPVLPIQIEEAGFAHALLGHYHDARTSGTITYPGSPEPLGWSEAGRHCSALLSVDDLGNTQVTLDDVNERQFAQETIDITGMTSLEHIRDAVFGIRDTKQLEGGVVRATLTGQRSRSLSLDPDTLSNECSDGFAYVEFRDRSQVSHDVEGVAQEFTSRGEMVRKLVDQKGQSRQEEQVAGRALQLALDAFDE